jgi:hypothetical protein
MPAIQPALDIFDKFISIAKELAKLPQLVLPQYRAAAQDLYEIAQKLLTANENLSRWLYKFLYFDFRQQDARTKFFDLMRDYKTMKQGPEFRQLKFSCGDIATIYYRNIASKLGDWLSDQTKLNEAQSMFVALGDVDSDLVSFTYDQVVTALDNALDDIEGRVEADAIDGAELRRLQAKADMKDITKRLEAFAGALSELVVSFANIARAPVTLGRP